MASNLVVLNCKKKQTLNCGFKMAWRSNLSKRYRIRLHKKISRVPSQFHFPEPTCPIPLCPILFVWNPICARILICPKSHLPDNSVFGKMGIRAQMGIRTSGNSGKWESRNGIRDTGGLPFLLITWYYVRFLYFWGADKILCAEAPPIYATDCNCLPIGIRPSPSVY